jgi:hypothetical protein
VSLCLGGEKIPQNSRKNPSFFTFLPSTGAALALLSGVQFLVIFLILAGKTDF